MEAVKKYWFWGIFISILSIFAMSHNANALTTTFSLNNYVIKNSTGQISVDCSYDDYNLANTQSLNYVANCAPIMDTSTTIALRRLVTHQTFNLKKDEIVEFYLLLSTPEGQGATLQGAPDVKNFTFESGTNGAYLLGFEQVSVSDFQQLNTYTSTNNNGNLDSISTSARESLAYVYRFTYLIRRDLNDIHIGLNTNSTNVGFYIARWINLNANYRTLMFYISNVTVYEYSGSDINKEVEQKTQEAVDESQTAGGDSSSSAQTGTTGLLNAITGAVSVISSAQPTNCKINGNMGNLDIGQLDLCANPAPAFVQTIGSLILILMCVPLAISLFNRFIAIFRSFQS